MVVTPSEALSLALPSPAAVIRLHDVIRVYREADVETIALARGRPRDRRRRVRGDHGSFGIGQVDAAPSPGGSDRPTAGRVIVDGIDLSRADETDRADLRGRRVGIVYQSQNLVPFLDLEENIELSATLAGRPVDSAAARAALERVGLGSRADGRPAQLSGGEQQRAAMAALLVTRPRILLGDEITGELDSTNAAALLDLVREIHQGPRE